MTSLILQPTMIADWQQLIKEAEDASHLHLNEDLESYLTFLLARFVQQPEIAGSVLAQEYLHGMQALGQEQIQLLREVGDKCLLFAGLFPGRAEHKRVKISYFVELGQGAYNRIAVVSKQQLAELYEALSTCFVLLMDVLHAMREYSSEIVSLKLIEAAELWQDTGSEYALTVLHRSMRSLPVSDKGNKNRH